MISRRSAKVTCAFVLLASSAACGGAPAPRELVDARASYNTARTGPAARVAPVQLDNARIALEQAEDAFQDDPDAQWTRDLAYIAQRKAEMAQAHARMEVAEQRREAAERRQEQLEEQLQQRTQQELSLTRDQLEAQRSQLAGTQQSLERERAARTEAERTAQAAMESLREIANVQEESRGLVITLSGAVLFASGESVLLPIAQQKLDQVAQTLVDQGTDHRFIVEGHTDSRGSSARNQELSLARAQAVRSYLVTKGVTSDQITAVGIGESRPVADNNSAEGRANNRRVEIIVEPERPTRAAAPAPAAPAPR